MTDKTAEMANEAAPATARTAADEKTGLDGRYRQIGISAVAAAVRYQGGAKNPAYAPAKAQDDQILARF
jgi:hypothetical protein